MKKKNKIVMNITMKVKTKKQKNKKNTCEMFRIIQLILHNISKDTIQYPKFN